MAIRAYGTSYGRQNQFSRQSNDQIINLAKQGNPKEALQVISQMRANREDPSTHALFELMKSYEQLGDINKAFETFHVIKRSGGADVYTYHFIIAACINNDRFDKVDPLVKEMQDSGVQLDQGIWNLVVKKEVLVGAMDKAQKIFSEKIGVSGLEYREGIPHIDCHGFTCETAFVQLQEFLKTHDGSPFSVIVGKGKHSKNGGLFYMKNYIVDRSISLPYQVRENPRNSGVIDFKKLKENIPPSQIVGPDLDDWDAGWADS
ncbi:MAG: hypothetical protein KDK76_05640 [Chlamydiia bacterium]|nr:hypothetical protein [Chlamydiia bacterium]